LGKKVFKKFFALGVLSVSVNTAALDINEYVAEVIQTHPLLMQRVHNYRQMVEDEKIASAGWRPSLDLVGSAGNYNTNSPITNLQDREYGSYNTELVLTQNLYAGNDTSNSIKQAHARVLSEMQRIYDDADNIAIEAISLYMGVIKEGELTVLAKQNVDSHEYILKKIQEYSGSGMGRKSDEKQTMSRLAQARAGMVAQQNNLQDALSKLHFFLGRYVGVNELVRPTAPEIPKDEIDVLVDRAFKNHPAMKSAYFNIEAAEHDYERSKSEFLPNVNLKLRKQIGDDIGGFNGPTDEYSVALELSYNLYNGGASSAGKQKKISGIYGHREFAQRVRRQITQSLRLSWAGSQALNMQAGYLSDHVRDANSTLELYRQEFSVGRRDLLDLLDAEQEYNTAQVKWVEAESDKVNAAYRVHEGIGELFVAMEIDVQLVDNELRIVALNIDEVDELPYSLDEDSDDQVDVLDQCENSLPDVSTRFGCAVSLAPTFGYEHITDTAEQTAANLNFIYDSVDLTPAGNDQLMVVMDELKSKVAHYNVVEIHAYTCNVASQGYNQDLSKRRAMALKRKLIDAGFSENRIRAYGHGENNPIASNKTEQGRDANRRVEFVVKHVYAN
jgi:adhesin transport system outer membrane protein